MSWLPVASLAARCDGPGSDGAGCDRLYHDEPGPLPARFTPAFAAAREVEFLADAESADSAPGPLPVWLFAADRHLCPSCLRIEAAALAATVKETA